MTADEHTNTPVNPVLAPLEPLVGEWLWEATAGGQLIGRGTYTRVKK